MFKPQSNWNQLRNVTFVGLKQKMHLEGAPELSVRFTLAEPKSPAVCQGGFLKGQVVPPAHQGDNRWTTFTQQRKRFSSSCSRTFWPGGCRDPGSTRWLSCGSVSWCCLTLPTAPSSTWQPQHTAECGPTGPSSGFCSTSKNRSEWISGAHQRRRPEPPGPGGTHSHPGARKMPPFYERPWKSSGGHSHPLGSSTIPENWPWCPVKRKKHHNKIPWSPICR